VSSEWEERRSPAAGYDAPRVDGNARHVLSVAGRPAASTLFTHTVKVLGGGHGAHHVATLFGVMIGAAAGKLLRIAPSAS
jgi:hypothetical protein